MNRAQQTAATKAANIILSGPLMGPGFVEKSLSRAITQIRNGQRFATITGHDLYCGWSLALSEDGFGTFVYGGELDAKSAEPTLSRLRGDDRVGKLFTEFSPICSLIHFQLCPKGQEVTP